MTLSGPSYICTCQRMPGPTCVNLQQEDPGQHENGAVRELDMLTLMDIRRLTGCDKCDILL